MSTYEGRLPGYLRRTGEKLITFDTRVSKYSVDGGGLHCEIEPAVSERDRIVEEKLMNTPSSRKKPERLPPEIYERQDVTTMPWSPNQPQGHIEFFALRTQAEPCPRFQVFLLGWVPSYMEAWAHRSRMRMAGQLR